MAAEPIVSLHMTVLNREDYLAEAVESVLAQTLPEWELLIWDDGSEDRSVEIARRFCRIDPRISLVQAEHLGNPAAHHQAIARARGRYIGWVDSDDVLEPTALADTAAVLEANPKVGMVYTDHRVMDAGGKILGAGTRSGIPFSPNRLLVDFMTFHFRLIRRSVYDRVGGIDTTLACSEDYDICLKLSEAADVAHLRKPLYRYRVHGGSISCRKRARQIESSAQAVRNALKRRGMDDEHELDVRITSRFVIRRKDAPDAPPLASPAPSSDVADTPPRVELPDPSVGGRVVLVMFSGGLDSTALLVHYLERGWRVHAHHIVIRNRENRWAPELRACERIIAHLRGAYGSDRLTWSNSGWDFRGFDRWFTYDSDLRSFVAGQVLRNLPAGADVAWGLVREDDEDPASVRRRALGRAEAVFAATSIGLPEPPRALTPLAGASKAELIEMIGPELFALTFSCRRPDTAGAPCGRCRTCRDLHNARGKRRTADLTHRP